MKSVMHLKSDHIKVMAYDDVNEIIEEVLRVQVFRSMFLVCGRGGQSRSGFIYSARWHLWLRWWFCGGVGWIGGGDFSQRFSLMLVEANVFNVGAHLFGIVM